MNRRLFVLSGSAAALAACSSSSAPNVPSGAASSTLVRQEVTEFSANAALVKAFRDGVKAMMNFADITDTRSWQFWHNSHWMATGTPPASMAAVWNQCPHRKPYFYAWHRAFLFFFEAALRTASGNPNFALPYWDYYKHPQLPDIFAHPLLADGTANPLYWPNREGSVVTGLTFEAFDPALTTFNRDPANADTFEQVIEGNPHGHVHDMVGGDMGEVPTAAADPIFWVHHCNVDRLWAAWINAGGGRRLPSSGDPWYNKSFTFNTSGAWTLSVPGVLDTTQLNYTYSDLTLPVAPPGSIVPEVAIARSLSGHVQQLTHAQSQVAGAFSLDLRPLQVTIPVTASQIDAAAVLILDGAQLTGQGNFSGYSYNLYANLPSGAVPENEEIDFNLGQLGTFAFSIESMNAVGGNVQITYPIGRVIAQQLSAGLAPSTNVTITFIPFGDPNNDAATTPMMSFRQLLLQG
ncbi:MAG TPA: tyrosinase family protein [Candidatus Rubrimentiphilum sp.]|nr:tyrosinase family protein [Candidatus Rubrimentiphilum sp.]